MQEYQALISRPDYLARLQAARAAIERVGGRLVIGAPNAAGIHVVILRLPSRYTPDDFVPGLPFTPA